MKATDLKKGSIVEIKLFYSEGGERRGANERRERVKLVPAWEVVKPSLKKLTASKR
jgi:hypothetical protein